MDANSNYGHIISKLPLENLGQKQYIKCIKGVKPRSQPKLKLDLAERPCDPQRIYNK